MIDTMSEQKAQNSKYVIKPPPFTEGGQTVRRKWQPLPGRQAMAILTHCVEMCKKVF